MTAPAPSVTTPVPRLSALVVAHNEEARLAGCLETLGFADEIVVVLDRCTDGSKTIAERFAHRIVEGAWDLEGPRRNTGIDACGGDWIVEIDADERVPPPLADEIRRTIVASPDDWHELAVDNYVGGRLIRWGWGGSFGTSSAPRLFRRGAKRWGDQRVHPSLTWHGRRGPRLSSPLIHHVDRNISDMMRRLDRYTTAKAGDLRQSGNPGSFAGNLRRLFSRFFKCYVSRRGYREGRWGFLVALMAGLYPLLSYLKATLEPGDDG
jgi:glycosyltransferase involved in cell wall biosynthesis